MGGASTKGIWQGSDATQQTRLAIGDDAVSKELRGLHARSLELSVCSLYSGLEESKRDLGGLHEELMLRRVSNKHRGIRWLTSINRTDETALVESYLAQGILVRHLSSFPALSFDVVDGEDGSAVALRLWHNLLVSKDPSLTRHFKSLFEELWESGVDAVQRIHEVRSGLDTTNVELIRSPREAMKRIWDQIFFGAGEVLLLFSSPAALRRHMRAGEFQTMNSLIDSKSMQVRILVPSNNEIRSLMQKEVETKEIEIRRIDESLRIEFTMVVIDRRHTFILETKDDAAEELLDSLGLVTYTGSKPMATSYATIFDTLWKQAEMFERLQAHEKIQSDFVNIAAHELRTPITPILMNAELLQHSLGRSSREVESIMRNAKRLQRLAQDLLDVARIDSGGLRTNPERFVLNELLASVVADFAPELAGSARVKMVHVREETPPALVRADKERIAQVISNLLTNSLEFTEEGTITVRLEVKEGSNNNNNKGGPKRAVVTVSDTGRGIDPSIKHTIFSKFGSASRKGNGLGLYIAKGVIEAHGGEIWGSNNQDSHGATFGFYLPVIAKGKEKEAR